MNIKRSSIFMIAVLTILLVSFGVTEPAQANNKSLGQQAEQEGKLRQALTHYVEALKANGRDQQLREKIIALALKLDPSPSIPGDARKHMARGEAAIEIAQSKEDFKEAVNEFGTAIYFAPWWADAYYNYSIAYEKAGEYLQAIWALKMYVLAAPHAQDIGNVQQKIYKLEYKAEKASRPAERLTGKWVGQRDGTYQPGPVAYRAYGKDVFRFEGDGTNIKATLLSTEKGYNTSFLGRFARNFTGEVIFRLRLEGSSITGVYLQPAFNECNRGREFPLNGNINEDSNTLTLSFVEKYAGDVYANDGSITSCARYAEFSNQPTKLTIKRVQ